jgi:hypothetical protein
LSVNAGKPRPLDRRPAEVAHVRVQRLGSRDREHHPAEGEESRQAVLEEEPDPVRRRQRAEDARVVGDAVDAERREDDEPDEHHRTEQLADRPGPASLQHEQHDQDRCRDRNDEVIQRRLHNLETLDGRQDRDRGRDHRVAEEQGGAEDPERDQPRQPCGT